MFSKCENADAELLAEISDDIRKINPSAEIVSEHYSGKDNDWWNGIFDLPGNEGGTGISAGNEGTPLMI